MASSTEDGDPHDGEVRLWPEGEWWVAKDLDTGVTTQGASRDAALDNLEEAVALYEGETGREPTDEELRDLGTGPADNETGDGGPLDVLE